VATEREQLLDELAKVYKFDIWCGCVLGRDDREQKRDVIERICEQHSAVYSR